VGWYTGVVWCGVQLTGRRRREDIASGQSTSESEADSDMEQTVCVALFHITWSHKIINSDESVWL